MARGLWRETRKERFGEKDSLLNSAASQVSVREILHGSAVYADACRLRHEVLRKPLGMDLYAEDLEQEKSQIHFGLFEGEHLVACLVVVPLDAGKAKLRQMAVAVDCQRHGLGRRLVQDVELELGRRGFQQLELHARLTAEGFYSRLGYRRHGEAFTEVGLPHVAMGKRLG